ncbi:uncharacterized protein LOC142549125 isoform X2 [Primulina tabacum]|uniref:uncharacterized protein LOC142549125 isoform X2 n=2 Tax=Primulina tabacum TaxID=48773 RepID=UPI003F5AC95E
MFNLKVILMWTINDFPAYGNLAGCATKGKLGCLICGEDIYSMWLKYSRNFTYLGYRRFLSPNHPFREKKKWFNGKKERGTKARHLTGLEILNAMKNIKNDWGKKKKSDTVNTSRKKGRSRILQKSYLTQYKRGRKNQSFSICHIGVFMKTLKGFVKNRARPEGFIAECYLAEEQMIFCSAYIKKVSIIGVRSNRNDDLENGLVEGLSISKGKEKILEDHVLQAAHRYVLFNTAEVEPYLHYVSCHTTCLIRSLHGIEKMSKMGKKRSKASTNEIQEHVASRLSGMNSNNSANSSQDFHDKEPIDDNKTDKKKGRGASKLKMISGQDKHKEVERNELGQSIGDNSVKYASFLGCMIKEFVPYTLDGWNDIDEEVKNKMWSCLQVISSLRIGKKKSIFQKLAKLWRDRKSKLQILIREANTSRVASRNLNLLKPEFMDQNQWDLFLKRTLSPTFQEKSARFRVMRVKQDHIHTMSRRGYAHLTHIMEKTTQGDTKITRSQVWIEGHKKKMRNLILKLLERKWL